MSILPFIAKPCPYLDRLQSVMDGELCTMCRKPVHDLSHLDEDGKAAFVAACGGEGCVSYRFDVRPAFAAALVAAGVAAIVTEPAVATPRPHATRTRHLQPPAPRPPRVETVPMVTAGVIAPPLPRPAPPKPAVK